MAFYSKKETRAQLKQINNEIADLKRERESAEYELRKAQKFEKDLPSNLRAVLGQQNLDDRIQKARAAVQNFDREIEQREKEYQSVHDELARETNQGREEKQETLEKGQSGYSNQTYSGNTRERSTYGPRNEQEQFEPQESDYGRHRTRREEKEEARNQAYQQREEAAHRRHLERMEYERLRNKNATRRERRAARRRFKEGAIAVGAAAVALHRSQKRKQAQSSAPVRPTTMAVRSPVPDPLPGLLFGGAVLGLFLLTRTKGKG